MMPFFSYLLPAVFTLFAVQAPINLAASYEGASDNVSQALCNCTPDLLMEEGTKENNQQTAEEEQHTLLTGTPNKNQWFFECRRPCLLCQNDDLVKRARESNAQPYDVQV